MKKKIPKLVFDPDLIETIAAVMHSKNLMEVELGQDNCYMRLVLNTGVKHHTNFTTVHGEKQEISISDLSSISPSESKKHIAPTPSSNVFDDDSALKSPIIGVAYLKPSPNEDPYCQVGDTVKKGQTVLIVEAMKVMNHIPAHKDGIVKEICVSDKQPVEFDDILMIIE